MSGKIGYRKFIVIPEDQYLQQNTISGLVEKTVEPEPEPEPQSSGNVEKTVEEQNHSDNIEKTETSEQQEGGHMTEGSKELKVARDPQGEREEEEGEDDENLNGPLKYYPTGGSTGEYHSDKKDAFVWLRPY
jgi:hypothetical protein